MQLPGSPAARGHLRLANIPSASRRTGSQLMLILRAALAAVVVAWISVIAWVGATLALLPIVWRRAPLGRRLRPHQRQARVIPFQPRRRALPR